MKKIFSTLIAFAMASSIFAGFTSVASAEQAGDNGDDNLTYVAAVEPVAGVGTGTGLKAGDQITYTVSISSDRDEIIKLMSVELYAYYNTEYFSFNSITETDDYSGYFDPTCENPGVITVAGGAQKWVQAAAYAEDAPIIIATLDVIKDVDVDQEFAIDKGINYAWVDYAANKNASSEATQVEYFMSEAKGANAVGEWYVLTNTNAVLKAASTPAPADPWKEATHVANYDGESDSSIATAYKVTLTGDGETHDTITWKATHADGTVKGHRTTGLNLGGDGSYSFGIAIGGVKTEAEGITKVEAALGALGN